MGVVTAFVMGAAIGAAVTRLIDQRRARQEAARLCGQLQQTWTSLSQLQEQQETADDLRKQLASAAVTIRQLQIERETASHAWTDVIILDRLEDISGITPRFAYRLNQAGILTYADLASQSPERLQDLVASDEEVIPAHDWMAQARTLAGEDDMAAETRVR